MVIDLGLKDVPDSRGGAAARSFSEQLQAVLSEYRRSHPDVTRAELQAALEQALDSVEAPLPETPPPGLADEPESQRVRLVTVVLAVVLIGVTAAALMLIRRP